MVAQTIHAAGESSSKLPSGTIAVALAAEDELELQQLQERLQDAGIDHTPIIEGEGSHSGQLMAVGLCPVTDRTAIRKVVSSLPLVQ